MNKTKIEWTDRTWNPVTGCTKVSQGCKNCYAERLYERFNGKGTFNLVHLHPERLNAPAGWKKPSMIFVNSMSDLFHESVPFQFIQQVFLKMLYTPRHTYQVLTKRPDIAANFFEFLRVSDNVMYDSIYCNPQILVGVSVEDQQTADERIPFLVQFPSHRFVSCEPLLGRIDILRAMGKAYENRKAINGQRAINWVICGGESGPKARPMHPDWARFLRDQCYGFNIPFFFKQWGEWKPTEYLDHDTSHYCTLDGKLSSRSSCGWITIPYGSAYFKRTGKKKSGYLLDGQTHHNFPNLK